MNSQNKDILISGASIAGPALAYWLKRYGFNPVVVERAPALREGGYPVDIRGAAVDVVERMGILDEVREAQTDTRGVSFVASSGRELVSVGMEAISGGGACRDVEIMRGELSRILYGMTNGVEYLFGDSIAAIEQRDQDVLVTFDNAEPRAFGLVVGADGPHSRVRELAFGPESRFRRDFGYYVSICTVGDDLGRDHWVRLHNEPGKLAGIYSAQRDTPAKAIFGFAAGRLDYDRRDPVAQKRIVAERVRSMRWQVPRLLADMAEATDFYFDSISQIHLDRWSTDRVVLVGDAGYGPSLLAGQGTSMALVGAYVLAGELANGAEETALRRYEAELREYVRQNQRLVKLGALALIPRNRWQLGLRNGLLRLVPRLPAVNRLASGVERSADSIRVREYEASGPKPRR